jgi:hypothetical protein
MQPQLRDGRLHSWYPAGMTFGKGQPLRQFSKYLRDPKERAERIVDVVERNSVIEGLPKLTPRRRQSLLWKLSRKK